MPFLEDLTLTFCLRPLPAFYDLATCTNLPSLQRLTLTAYLWECAIFLESITVSSGCSINLYTNHDKWDLENLTAAYSAFRRSSETYFSTDTAKALSLHISSRLFYFTDLTTWNGPVDHSFCLSVTSKYHLFLYSELCHIISSFSSQVANVEYFHCQISQTTIRPSNPHFFQFLSGLKSVDAMEIIEDTLKHFPLDAVDVIPTILPKLRVLIYCEMPKIHSASGGSPTPEPLLSFLRWRRNVGALIKVLDLTYCMSLAYTHDFGFLEEMTGFVVAWYIRHERFSWAYREYFCGSGNPEMLMLSCTGPRNDGNDHVVTNNEED